MRGLTYRNRLGASRWGGDPKLKVSGQARQAGELGSHGAAPDPLAVPWRRCVGWGLSLSGPPNPLSADSNQVKSQASKEGLSPRYSVNQQYEVQGSLARWENGNRLLD